MGCTSLHLASASVVSLNYEHSLSYNIDLTYHGKPSRCRADAHFPLMLTGEQRE